MSKTAKKTVSPSGSKLMAIGFAALAVIATIAIGHYWLISVAALAFLVLAPFAILSYLGKDRLLTFFTNEGSWRFVLPIVYLFVLIVVPPYGEWAFRHIALKYTQTFEYVTKKGERDQNPQPLIILWTVDDTKFTDEQKKLLKRWNPLIKEDDTSKTAQKEMLVATWLQDDTTLKADLIVPFDSTEIEPDDPRLMITFDDVQATLTTPPEDPKEGEATTTTVSYLKVTFVTPITSGKPRFNTYVTVLTDLNMSVQDFIRDGLARSARGEKGMGQDEEEEAEEEEADAGVEDEDAEEEDDE